MARELYLPFVTKDDYKGLVLARQPDLPREVIGPLSFDLMWHVAGVTLAAGIDTLLETHFYRGISEAKILELAQAHRARLVQIFCHVPLEVLRERHAARVASGARPGIDLPFDHALAPANWCHTPLALGQVPCLEVDTSLRDPLPEALRWVKDRQQSD
ncbi:ATP-binding protein (plasmid) [Deinococcus sp. QL22]|nr:ATP-binding protein [Deinococcus sp. QL22]